MTVPRLRSDSTTQFSRGWEPRSETNGSDRLMFDHLSEVPRPQDAAPIREIPARSKILGAGAMPTRDESSETEDEQLLNRRVRGRDPADGARAGGVARTRTRGGSCGSRPNSSTA